MKNFCAQNYFGPQFRRIVFYLYDITRIPPPTSKQQVTSCHR